MAAAFLAVFQFTNPAMAMSPCHTSECGLSGLTLVYSLPVSGLGVLAGTFLTPAVANNIADQDIAYWKLSLANFVVSTTTAVGVAVGTLGLFNEDQAGGYIVTCALAPIAASAFTSWAMHTFMDKEPSGANAALDAWVPAVAVVATPDQQGVLLAWRL